MPVLKRLTQDSFKAYGHVGKAGEGMVKVIRNGGAVLTRSALPFEHDDTAPDHALEFYQVKAEGAVFTAAIAERHSHSCQMFIPMDVARYLVVVWPDHPDTCAPEAFVASPEDVIVYKPGVWHHGIVALDRDGLFASTMWKTRGGTDVEFHTLANAVAIALGEPVA